LTLASAAFAEYAGIHAVFGAFITGAAVGESAHLRERTSEHIREIVTNVFAPLFFASIGLHTNFVTNFHPAVTAFIIGVACLGKVLGAGWGARLGGMDWHTSIGVGLAMNARGAIEMILGILALQAGLIREPMFVALVVMALVTVTHFRAGDPDDNQTEKIGQPQGNRFQRAISDQSHKRHEEWCVARNV
jgi:Kef-type K+ transport system membrane component KefB